jgi:ABC-type multidrug transport system fused ATPase/permease subunit
MPNKSFSSKSRNALNPLRRQKQLMKFALLNAPILFWASLLILLGSFFELIGLTCLQPIFTRLGDGQSDSSLNMAAGFAYFGAIPSTSALILIFSGCFFVRTAASITGQGALSHGLKNLQKRISCTIFKNILQKVDASEIESRKIGFFISLAGDEAVRAAGIVQLTLSAAQGGVLALMYSLTILLLSPRLFLTLIVIGLGAFLIVALSQRRSLQLGSLSADLSRAAGTIFIDGLSGFRSLRAIHGTGYVIDKYDRLMSKYMITQRNLDIFGIIVKLSPLLLIFAAIFGAALLTPPIELNSFLKSNGFFQFFFLPFCKEYPHNHNRAKSLNINNLCSFPSF